MQRTVEPLGPGKTRGKNPNGAMPALSQDRNFMVRTTLFRFTCASPTDLSKGLRESVWLRTRLQPTLMARFRPFLAAIAFCCFVCRGLSPVHSKNNKSDPLNAHPSPHRRETHLTGLHLCVLVRCLTTTQISRSGSAAEDNVRDRVIAEMTGPVRGVARGAKNIGTSEKNVYPGKQMMAISAGRK